MPAKPSDDAKARESAHACGARSIGSTSSAGGLSHCSRPSADEYTKERIADCDISAILNSLKKNAGRPHTSLCVRVLRRRGLEVPGREG
jgi:hypothetical protein